MVVKRGLEVGRQKVWRDIALSKWIGALLLLAYLEQWRELYNSGLDHMMASTAWGFLVVELL